jgi:hypothetical protein
LFYWLIRGRVRIAASTASIDRAAAIRFRAALRGKVARRIRRQPTIDPSEPTSSARALVGRFFCFYDAGCRLAVSAISLQHSFGIRCGCVNRFAALLMVLLAMLFRGGISQ